MILILANEYRKMNKFQENTTNFVIFYIQILLIKSIDVVLVKCLSIFKIYVYFWTENTADIWANSIVNLSHHWSYVVNNQSRIVRCLFIYWWTNRVCVRSDIAVSYENTIWLELRCAISKPAKLAFAWRCTAYTVNPL